MVIQLLVADSDLQIREGGADGHPDREIRGGGSQKEGAAPTGPSPRSATGIYHAITPAA